MLAPLAFPSCAQIKAPALWQQLLAEERGDAARGTADHQ